MPYPDSSHNKNNNAHHSDQNGCAKIRFYFQPICIKAKRLLEMSKEIIFILAPICPKCVRIKRWLKELEKTHPEIKISRYNIVTQFKEVKKFKIKTIPTLIIGNIRLDSWIKEEEYIEAIKQL